MASAVVFGRKVIYIVSQQYNLCMYEIFGMIEHSFFGSRTFKKYPELIGDTRYVEDYARLTDTQKKIEVCLCAMIISNIDHVTIM